MKKILTLSYLFSLFKVIFVLSSLATDRSILYEALKRDEHYQNHEKFVHLISKRIDFLALSVAFLYCPEGQIGFYNNANGGRSVGVDTPSHKAVRNS